MTNLDLTPEWRRFNEAVVRLMEAAREVESAVDSMPTAIERWNAAITFDTVAQRVRDLSDGARERHPRPDVQLG